MKIEKADDNGKVGEEVENGVKWSRKMRVKSGDWWSERTEKGRKRKQKRKYSH